MTDATPVPRARWPAPGDVVDPQACLALVFGAVDAVARLHAARQAIGSLSRDRVVRRPDGTVAVLPNVPVGAPVGHGGVDPWMPPDAATASAASRDVFALGMAAYELLVGATPEVARTRRSWRALARRDNGWPAIGPRAPEVDPAVVRVIDRALGPESTRPSNAVVLRALLRSALPGGGDDAAAKAPESALGAGAAPADPRSASHIALAATPTPPPTHVARPARWTRAVWGVTTVAVLGVAAAAAWTGRGSRWDGQGCEADADCPASTSCFAGWCAAPGLAFVPPGTFMTGPSPGEVAGDREPSYQVRVRRPLFVQTHEVTQGEWEQLMGTRPSWFRDCGPDCPVESVNWYEAVEFANARSRAEGLQPCYELAGCEGTIGEGCPGLAPAGDGVHFCLNRYSCDTVSFVGLDCEGYRLPTEQEWELAARAGTTTSTYAGPMTGRRGTWHRDLELLSGIAVTPRTAAAAYPGAWPCGQIETRRPPAAACGPAAVAERRPNDLGLYDMLGNVAEWTQDGWSNHPGLRSGRSCGLPFRIRRALGLRPRIGPDGSPVCDIGTVADFFVDTASGPRAVRGGSWFHRETGARATARQPSDADARMIDIGFRLVRTATRPRN